MKVKRKHKSIRLTPKEKAELKKKVGVFPSKEVAAEAIGLTNRDTLSRVLKVGSGRQDTIDTIRKYLGTAA